MYTLHIKQINRDQAEQYRVFITLRSDDPAEPADEATVDFAFSMTELEQEDLRWYLEDYLQQPFDPNPQLAARIEERMAQLGRQLFRDVFESADARDLWAVLRRQLNQTRVQIGVEDVRQATAVPWELLRDPKTDVPLALRAAAFVRTYTQPVQRAPKTQVGAVDEKTRILLVICRPGGQDDVPFRSVASRLIKGLSEEMRQQFQLDVLRPPTFARLSQVLRQANEEDQPYHIVHFDGHGTYVEGPEQPSFIPSTQIFKGMRSGNHGYLIFEDPEQEDNVELVDGLRLGNLLVETNTPVLVLNACRSAHAETDSGATEDAPITAEMPSDPQLTAERPARAFGSLAQEVMDTGVAGIVAMRYNVYSNSK